MGVLDIQNPNRIHFGIDALNKAGDIARVCGERAVIITESELRDNPYLAQLQSVMSRAGVNCLVFDDLRATSGNETIQTIINTARASKAHSVIGFGGMKAISIARTVAALAPSRVGLERFLAGEQPREAGLPFISVPTTCRDHFMTQPNYVMTDGFRQRPVVVRTPLYNNRLVVLDPKISMSLSPKYYNVVLLDVLLAAIEAYTSAGANFHSDMLSMRAIETIGQCYSEVAFNPKDIRPRVRASEACLLTSQALSTTSLGIGAAISFAVNSRYNIPKSWAATAVLPFLLDLHAIHQPARVASIARALGEEIDAYTSEEAALRASKAVRRIVAKFELPSRLRDFNVSIDMLPEIAEIAAELEYSRSVPFTASHQAIYDLVKQAY
jgi:alcohol dehydrogenase